MSAATTPRRRAFLAALALALAATLMLSTSEAVAHKAAASPHAITVETGGPAYTPTPPTLGGLDADGQDDRFLLGGNWLTRLDPDGVGVSDGYWQDTASTAGWSTTTIPNSFNAGDLSTASFYGSVAWYRRDFTLPSNGFAAYVPAADRAWAIEFESVNYHATIWLNGHELGTHSGAYLPFQLLMSDLQPGVNRLVVRVDNILSEGDFPPRDPGAGWWNYGGILDAVYIVPVARAEVESWRIRTPLACPTCSAVIEEQATVENPLATAQTVELTGRYGGRLLRFGSKRLAPGQIWQPTASTVIAHPRLWNPGAPQLYRATLTLRDSNNRALTGFTFMSGIRTIAVRNGILSVNGRQVHLRGVNMHEQTANTGAALSMPAMERLMGWVKGLGATIIREHYPMNPELEEMADEDGIMLWSEIPVYHPATTYLDSSSWRATAVQLLEDNIDANQDHPSILLWSIGNELSVPPDSGQASYISQAVAAAHRLDPTRPVGMALYEDPWDGCQPAYAPLQVIGANVYFGWFQSDGSIDNAASLGPYMQRVRNCYPKKAIFASEFGYDGDEAGPVEVRGTYQNQIYNTEYALSVFTSEHWLAGAIYHTIQDWASSPGWDGNDPLGTPPIVQRGLIDVDGGVKPAYAVVRSIYQETQQIAPPSG